MLLYSAENSRRSLRISLVVILIFHYVLQIMRGRRKRIKRVRKLKERYSEKLNSFVLCFHRKKKRENEIRNSLISSKKNQPNTYKCVY